MTVVHDAISQQTIDSTLQITHTAIAGLSNKGHNIIRNLQTIATNLVADNIFTQLHIWLFKLTYQATGETGNQAVWHILQLHRWTVARQDNAFSITEEMIEYMEESVQCLSLSCPILNIIHYQNINRLIEIDEIIAGIMQDSIRILSLKKTGTDIKHTLLRIYLLCLQTDSIHQMRLTTSRWTINEHRVELSGIRMLSNRQSHRTRQLIALTLYIIIECKLRIELGINVILLKSLRNDTLGLSLLRFSVALSNLFVSRISL